VGAAKVWGREVDVDGSAGISASCASVQFVSTGTSGHSYTRRWLSDAIVAYRQVVSKMQGGERRRARTSFSPSWWGANSTARTVPFASASTARSTQRVPGPLAAVDAPFACGWSVFSAGISSQTFTVRSNEELARTGPNSGCAHDSFVTAAPWAWQQPLSRKSP
jgi:hypothetical protein